LLLRHLWQPQGPQWVADELLHDVMRLLSFAARSSACIPIRSSTPGQLGYRRVFSMAGSMLIAFICISAALVALDCAKRSPTPGLDARRIR
jgi:hypothetical protein